MENQFHTPRSRLCVSVVSCLSYSQKYFSGFKRWVTLASEQLMRTWRKS